MLALGTPIFKCSIWTFHWPLPTEGTLLATNNEHAAIGYTALSDFNPSIQLLTVFCI